MNNLLNLVIALFAIVPSIIIAVLYSFLTNIQIEADRLESRKVGYSDASSRGLVQIRHFTVLSSKFFHLTMSFYLSQIMSSLVGWLLASDFENEVVHYDVAFNTFTVTILIYTVYSAFYLIADVASAFRSNNIRMWHVLPFILLFVVFPPLMLYILLVLNNNEVSMIIVLWVSGTALHLVFWWWNYPFVYKPLTHLSRCIKESHNL